MNDLFFRLVIAASLTFFAVRTFADDDQGSRRSLATENIVLDQESAAEHDLQSQTFYETVRGLGLSGINSKSQDFSFQLYLNSHSKNWEIMTPDRHVAKLCPRTKTALHKALAMLKPDWSKQKSRVTVSCSASPYAMATCQVIQPQIAVMEPSPTKPVRKASIASTTASLD